jgi:phosphocarrier protein HPr
MTLETREPNGRSNGEGSGQENGQENGKVVTGSVRLVHAAGMHARPAVKLTKLAKTFQAHISIRASDAGEWINAKSIAKVMAMRAARESVIQIKASGEDAESAVAALVDLVATDFPDAGA